MSGNDLTDQSTALEGAASMGAAPRQRRFIAGAVCPRCSVMDRIVVSADGETRSCIDCGFTDARPGPSARELPTRVTRAASRRVETAPDPVRLVDLEPPTSVPSNAKTKDPVG